ncbi:MAG: hypothetical protein WBC15_18035 [Mycobacterium sp.]
MPLLRGDVVITASGDDGDLAGLSDEDATLLTHITPSLWEQWILNRRYRRDHRPS